MSDYAAAKAQADAYHAKRTELLKNGGELAWQLVFAEREAEMLREARVADPYPWNAVTPGDLLN